MHAVDDVETDFFEAPPAGRRRVRRRRRDAARHRRPSLLLAALVAGGVAAGVVGLHGTPGAQAQSTTSVLAAQQALAAGDDDAAALLPRASITLAEAQQRLHQVAASRAAREKAAARAREAARPKAAVPMHGTLTSCFCARWGTFHYGIDIAGPMDTPEYAAEDGVVLRAGPATGFGLAVYILHADGYVTVYGHMDVIKVRVGQYVQAGQTIALEGARGEATGPHLHFEVHKGGEYGTPIDPIPWLRARGVTV
jgi:murein DD-endopeptidase MepM/ murein hydrolase activator NlpD